MQDEEDWPSAAVADYEDVHELIADMPGNMATIGPLLDAVDDFRVVDPACGSGHFLTSTVAEITKIRKELYARNESYPDERRLKKRTVRTNIYGVDILDPAVEIAKLRLWLSIIADLEREDISKLQYEELALPNLAYNIRTGNSLIGYVDLLEETNGDTDQYTLEKWDKQNVREKYQDIIQAIQNYKDAVTNEQALSYRSEAEELLNGYREDLNTKLRDDFEDAGVDDVLVEDIQEHNPFHWVLEFAEVYGEGGFDVIIGNPPWDRIKPNKDEYFSSFDPAFTSLPSNAKDDRMDELLETSDIEAGWERYKNDMDIRAQYFNATYTLQQSKVAGRTESSENDLSSLFLERVFNLAKQEGYVQQVLPGRIFTGSPTKSLRMRLLETTTITSLIGFENHGIFEEIDTRYNFGVLVFKNSGETETLPGIFSCKDINITHNINEVIADIPREVLTEFAPNSRLFPLVQSKKDLKALEKLIACPAVASLDRSWYCDPRYMLHKTLDSERFFDDPENTDYPILTGKNFFQYVYDDTYVETEPVFQWSVNEEKNSDRSAKYRAKEKEVKRLKTAIYNAFDGGSSSKSQKAFVNDLLEKNRGKPLSLDDSLIDCTEYRLGFRRVARATDERSLIAAVVPPGPICDYSFYVIRPYEIQPTQESLGEERLHSMYEKIFTDKELFAALGLLNSLAFDFLIQRKIDNSIPMYSFRETQVPDLTEGDNWFEFIWTRAARLNCYGDAFAEMRERLGGLDPATLPEERDRLRAEIDVAAFQAYGIDREQAAFIVENVHRVQNPRIMTERYFELILKKYDELAEKEVVDPEL